MLVVRAVTSPLDISQPGIAITANSSGVSGTILDDLSGTYKTFTEAVKELISNAYDADARKVELRFMGNYERLEVEDDGAGMNPRQFVREYIRVGRSVDAKPRSPSGKRERIGGKGIGSLAPARYCRRLVVHTKTRQPVAETVTVRAPASGEVPLEDIFPHISIAEPHLGLFDQLQYQVVAEDGSTGTPVTLQPRALLMLPPRAECLVSYSFAAERILLRASIDFVRLRQLGEEINLERVADLWQLELVDVDPGDYSRSFTLIAFEGLEEFVSSDLRAPGKPGAKNISSKSGIDRFMWTLSRLCPVRVQKTSDALGEKFPMAVVDLLLSGDSVQVQVSHPGSPQVHPLSREVHVPNRPVRDQDAALCRLINLEDQEHGVSVRGYILGSSTIIYPAELRGISIRVKGVELGVPTLFGAEALVTGPQHAALTAHITGELHVEGVDVRRDILPGREGLYPESPVYRALRRKLTGIEERLGGELRELVSEILVRSESHGSAQGLVKKLELQRRALLDAASAIATMAELDEYMLDRLLTPPDEDPRLLLCPDIEVRPEGRLAPFTIEYGVLARGVSFEIDYERRRLILPDGAPYLEKTVDIAGQRFTVMFKQGGRERVFCEVDPDGGYLFINWDHPVRGAMGDATYIKHCLAAVACGLPQADLNRYVRLIATRS